LAAYKVRIFNSVPLEFYGGGEISLSTLAIGLASKGYDVEYVADSDYSGPERAGPEMVSALVKGFRYQRATFMAPSRPLNGTLRKPMPGRDILTRDGVNLIVVDRFPSRWFLNIVAREKIRVVLLLHGISFDQLRSLPPRVFGLEVYNRLWARACAQAVADSGIHVQVFNTRMHSALVRAGWDAGRIWVIPSGVSFQSSSQHATRPFFQVVFIGRMVAETKGIRLLAQIISGLAGDLGDELRMKVVGSGADAGLIDRAVRGTRAEYLGFVDEGLKTRILRESDLLLSTSSVEPFGMTLVEGLAEGVRFLATPTSGPVGIAETNSIFGRICGAKSKYFVEAIRYEFRLWRSNPERYQMQAMTRKSVARHEFDGTKMIDRYARMIQHVSEGRSSLHGRAS
jgi:glycosyltransferase involved in cell wall biosynthesis